jgi:tetratricopeptide (TPR) repeat protein
MGTTTAEKNSPTQRDIRFHPSRWTVLLVSAIAIAYGFLAGFHTLQDVDLGWQLATGRWVIAHHRVFSKDVFSYTASGQPWIYPALSGVLFYLSFMLGGYSLVSWMGAIASAGVTALLVSRKSLVVSALALVAVPLIANRTQPRAEMFTTILFAAFLGLLWGQYRNGRGRLWLLPPLMVLWVNLHPGFAAGLALCLAYVLMEALELSFVEKRAAAINRLRRSWPWLTLTAAATLVNPFVASIYTALARQQQAQSLHNLWLVEWESIRFSSTSFRQALDLRDPQSSFWWLLAIAAVTFFIALWRKQVGAALVLAASVYFAVQHVRLQALFACVAVVVGGSFLEEGIATFKKMSSEHSVNRPVIQWASIGLLTLAFTGLAVFRSYDLISDRYFLRSTQRSLFGAGLSWWFPERAVDFLQREKLPANIFNGYSLGGYLTWRLFPAYRDYIDSRALPFGPEFFFRAYDLATAPPNSPVWQQEAIARDVNTIVVPLSRYQGMSLFPHLRDFCHSQQWRPVYMDEVSALFLRVTSQTAALADRLQIDCTKISFTPGPELIESHSRRAKAELFNFWTNAGGILYSLERYSEALADLDRAQSIFQQNANLHLLRALVFQEMGRATEAESEFRTSLNLEPSDEAWFDFGLFYMTQKRYPEAAEIFGKFAESSSRPHEMWMMLGEADVQMHQPQPALEAFDKAVATSPLRDAGESLGGSFNALIATGRAGAWYQLGDVPQAVAFQEQAVTLAPTDPNLWQGLGDLYEVQGRTTKAAEARARAKAIRSQ